LPCAVLVYPKNLDISCHRADASCDYFYEEDRHGRLIRAAFGIVAAGFLTPRDRSVREAAR
jgi:hypothetical protein